LHSVARDKERRDDPQIDEPRITNSRPPTMPSSRIEKTPSATPITIASQNGRRPARSGGRARVVVASIMNDRG
jgi:hypothetical protein